MYPCADGLLMALMINTKELCGELNRWTNGELWQDGSSLEAHWENSPEDRGQWWPKAMEGTLGWDRDQTLQQTSWEIKQPWPGKQCRYSFYGSLCALVLIWNLGNYSTKAKEDNIIENSLPDKDFRWRENWTLFFSKYVACRKAPVQAKLNFYLFNSSANGLKAQITT